jgi:hypothetical protein
MSVLRDVKKNPAMKYASLDIAAPWPMPEWLPDETFFSLASRYHAISGNRLPLQTNLALFGRPRGGSQHDFPSHLKEFEHRTQQRLGSAENIASSRTILPFFLPARSNEEAKAALDSLISTPGGMLKYRLGILTSRFRAHHPLKACPACLEADDKEHGTSYWRRMHQLPGVWICPLHTTMLHEATLKSSGVMRFGWILPNADILRPVTADPGDVASISALNDFARLSQHWSKLAPASVNVDVLGQTYRSALRLSGRSTDRHVIARSYCEAIAPLRVVPELDALPATPEAALHQINRWVFAPRGNTHPLRHLSFIFWLFRDWQSFWSTYDSMARPRYNVDSQTEPGGLPPPDHRKTSLVELIRSGTSANTAARALGINTATAIAWATAAGLVTRRRPKILKDDKRAGLIEALMMGCGKADAAAQHGVSIQSVTRLLRSEVGLREAWYKVRLERSRTQARSVWDQTLRTFGDKGVAAARRQEPSTYAWLYRNDRPWLVAACANVDSARSRPNAPRLDWDSRDSQLANEVRQAAARLAEQDPNAPLKLWQLYQLVPELKAKLGALERLPLTRGVISTVTRPRRPGKVSGNLI